MLVFVNFRKYVRSVLACVSEFRTRTSLEAPQQTLEYLVIVTEREVGAVGKLASAQPDMAAPEGLDLMAFLQARASPLTIYLRA